MTESSVAPAPPAAREPAAAVEARGLVKTYSSRTGTVEAVRGVDLRVEAGEVFGFLGPNGAGKSTMVRMLTTLLSFMSGEAHVAESTSRANRTRCVGAPMSAANR